MKILYYIFQWLKVAIMLVAAVSAILSSLYSGNNGSFILGAFLMAIGFSFVFMAFCIIEGYELLPIFKRHTPFVYIYGVKGRGEEVIEKLEDLGGKNMFNLKGNNPNRMYFIDENKFINYRYRPTPLMEDYYKQIYLD